MSEITLPLFDVDDPSSFPPTPTEIVKGIIYQSVLTTIWGAPESGKSHIALDMACTIAQKFPVLYVSAEAPYEAGLRATAWMNYYKTTCKGNLKVWKEPVLLMKKKSVDFFINSIALLSPVVIFFDPLAQCFIGGDENSARDMGIVAFHLNKISRVLGSGICIVAHSGWNGGHERGSSALRGANRISLSATQSQDGIIKLHSEKMNAGKPIEDKYFSIKQIGSNEMHTVLFPAPKEAPPTKGISERQKQVLMSLAMPIFSGGVQRVEIAKYAEATYGLSTGLIYKAINVLIEKELATVSIGGKVLLSDEGKDLADSFSSDENSKPKFSSSNYNWILTDSHPFSSYSHTILNAASSLHSQDSHSSPLLEGEVENGEEDMDLNKVEAGIEKIH